MRLTINAAAFREAMATVQGTIDQRQESDAYLLFIDAAKDPDRLRLCSSNGIERTLLKTACKVGEPGRVAIVPRELIKVLPTLNPDETLSFSIKKDQKSLGVKIGSSNMRLPVTSKHDLLDIELKLFPFDAAPVLTVNSLKLREILRRAEPFVYRKEDGPSMQSVLLMTEDNHLLACSTNRAVIAKARINGFDLPDKGNGAGQVLISIPFRSLLAMEKILDRLKGEEKNGEDVKLILTYHASQDRPNGLFVRTEDVFYGTSLSGYDFPSKTTKIDQMVEVTGQIQLDRNAMLCALRRAQPFSRDGRWVNLELANNTLNIQAASQTAGEIDETVAGFGEGTGAGEVTLSIDYLIAGLGAIREDSVIFQLTDKSVVMLKSGAAEQGQSTYAYCIARA